MIDAPEGELLLEETQVLVVERPADEFDQRPQLSGVRLWPGRAASIPEPDQSVRDPVPSALELLGRIALIADHDHLRRVGTQVVGQQCVVARQVRDGRHERRQRDPFEVDADRLVVLCQGLGLKIETHRRCLCLSPC